MKSILALLLLLTGTARADDAVALTPPSGWTSDPKLANLPKVERFGGAPTRISVHAFRAPAPGAVLFVTRAEAVVPADRRDALATAELDELRAAMRRQGANAKAEAWNQQVDPAARSLEAALSWRDPSVGLVDSSRIVIAADASRVVAVTGQCVMAVDVRADLSTACTGALRTLDPGIPVASRVALAIVGDVAPAEAGGPEVAVPAANRTREPARLHDGSRVALPPMAVAPDHREPDRRPIYLGGGLIALAALFYWNRRRRERFEKEDRTDQPVEPDPAAPIPPAPSDDVSTATPTDDDGDDLHAAAGEPAGDPAGYDGGSHER